MLQVTIKFLSIFLKIPNTIFKLHEDIHVQQWFLTVTFYLLVGGQVPPEVQIPSYDM